MGVSEQSTNRPRISATVICFNEERNIARCLDSLNWCDEIVVLDSGSTDRTREIASSYENVRFSVRPFDNFINQKNAAQHECIHDWILSVDADEMIPLELAKEIMRLDFAADGYWIGRRTFVDRIEIKYGVWNPDFTLRLYRRRRGRWGGTNPHESVLLDGPMSRLNHRMLHYSYTGWDDYLQRNYKYTQMMVDFLIDEGRLSGGRWTGLHHGAGNFLKSYFLKRGVLDGWAGLYVAWHTARFSFLKYKWLADALREGSERCRLHVSNDNIECGVKATPIPVQSNAIT